MNNYVVRTARVTLLTVSTLCFTGFGFADQAGIITKDTAVWEKPSRSSNHLTEIRQDSLVNIKLRKGGWYQVQLDDSNLGWVPILHLRFETQAEENQRSIADILRQTAEMPTSAGVTTGVRGMSEENLKADNFDADASLEKTNTYIPTAEDTQHFAIEGELKASENLKLENQ